jgi:hypothetical protein
MNFALKEVHWNMLHSKRLRGYFTSFFVVVQTFERLLATRRISQVHSARTNLPESVGQMAKRL